LDQAALRIGLDHGWRRAVVHTISSESRGGREIPFARMRGVVEFQGNFMEVETDLSSFIDDRMIFPKVFSFVYEKRTCKKIE
jgi:hypothetical protein